MNKENKIIPFLSRKSYIINKRKSNGKYNLVYTFTINVLKKGNKVTFNYFYPEEISKDEAFKILFEIYLKASRLTEKTEGKISKIQDISFDILYFANENNPKDFKFLCKPNIESYKLAAMLWSIINNS